MRWVSKRAGRFSKVGATRPQHYHLFDGPGNSPDETRQGCIRSSDVARTLRVVTVHPLLEGERQITERQDQFSSDAQERLRNLYTYYKEEIQLPRRFLPSLLPFFNGEKQSWERIQLTTPPTCEADIKISSRTGKKAKLRSWQRVAKEDGLTLGDIFAQIRDGGDFRGMCKVVETTAAGMLSWDAEEEGNYFGPKLQELSNRVRGSRVSICSVRLSLHGAIIPTALDQLALVSE